MTYGFGPNVSVNQNREKARVARGFARSVGPYLQTRTHYPRFGIHKPGKLEELEKALQIQLEAVAAKAGKGEDEIRRARAQIFTVLNEKGGRAGLWMPRVDQGKRDVASEFFDEYTPLAYVGRGHRPLRFSDTLTAKTGAALGTAFNVIIKVVVQRGLATFQDPKSPTGMLRI